jgi:signal transduction histidine kinase
MSRKIDPNTYRIDVRDSGVGILREQLNTIFEEFTSYSGGSDRSGGGLGLAICRMIMQQHDGKVWAENVEGGAMLSFVIPYRRSEARTTPDEPINKKPFQNWKSEVRVDTGG